nr:hypothetical protein [uncultured Desulfobacter sp.]
MSRSEKNIKMGVLVVVSIIFVITAYVTFFKKKPENQVRPPRPDVAEGAPQENTPGTDRPEPINLDPNGQEPDLQGPYLQGTGGAAEALQRESQFEFTPTIRDIFAVPASGLTAAPRAVQNKKEREAIKKALTYKGAILHGSRAVAVINDQFFHVGDKVDGYKILSISAQEVTIDTPGGTLTLEIIKL